MKYISITFTETVESMKKFALIVAGGSGSRMKGAVPKQFLELNGLPVLMHTFNVFVNYDPHIEFILVLPENQVGYWEELCEKYRFQLKYKLAPGGQTRFHSVKNGLGLIKGEGVVFIHDGVRPLVSLRTIKNCFAKTVEKGNALPVVPVAGSIRFVEGESNNALDRSKHFLVQTPQTFQTKLIKNAFRQPYSELFTDDASVLENFGHTIYLVEGNRENIKITFPEDILMAGSILNSH